jgi:hypothetical protein
MKPTKNDLLDALAEFGKARARRPAGKGWYTLDEAAASATPATTPAAIRYQMKMARAHGVVIEQVHGTALDEDGRARRATFYRTKP